MIRYIRSGALIGALTLGAACNSDPLVPEESDFVPRPDTYVPADTATTTRISGLAWDPEAFFLSLVGCGDTCPFPPLVSDGLPLYQMAAVRNGAVTAFDPVAVAPAVAPETTDAVGMWVLPKVPSRAGAPFFMLSLGQGTLPTESIAGLEPVPPAEYLPTLTMRPISTVHSTCTSQEVFHASKKGILQAVAKHLTVVKGVPTTVEDLINPAKYYAATVFWLFHAGNGALRVPAAMTAVEASAGQVFFIDWAPSFLPPASLRSERGFIVTTDAPASPMGITVVLVPNNGAPPPELINYKIVDTVTDAATRRPWFFPPISAPIAPTVIGFAGLQMMYQPSELPGYQLPPPPGLCLPL
ncbi:MAG TPA: hypothetical protein VF794_38530 [Archangium sp.]|jgi:hypothetical protein|uniref:hypothetical protein n=1 Tax=Archangium sp. TaxID=1872627 RepID=UPI002ED972EE